MLCDVWLGHTDCVQHAELHHLLCPKKPNTWARHKTSVYCTQSVGKYCMARNFRGLKISRFLWINHEPRKFYPRKFYPSSFLTTRTAHTQCVVLLFSTRPSVVLSILCSVVVSLWFSTDIFKLRSNLVASYPILVVLSRLIPSSSIVSTYEKV